MLPDEATPDAIQAVREAVAAHLDLSTIRGQNDRLQLGQDQSAATLARIEATQVRIEAQLVTLATSQRALAEAEQRIADREEARAKLSAARWERWLTPFFALAAAAAAWYQSVQP